MKFISWNVNGIRACVTKGFLDFFKGNRCRYILLTRNKTSRRANKFRVRWIPSVLELR